MLSGSVFNRNLRHISAVPGARLWCQFCCFDSAHDCSLQASLWWVDKAQQDISHRQTGVLDTRQQDDYTLWTKVCFLVKLLSFCSVNYAAWSFSMHSLSQKTIPSDVMESPNRGHRAAHLYKKLRYRRVTARCVLPVVILPITTQQCRNYLYDKSWPNRWYEVGGLVGGNVS